MSNQPAETTNTKSAEELSKQAWVHFANREYESALVEFREALKANAHLLDAVYGFAMTLRYKGEHAQAVKAYEQVVKMIGEGAVTDVNRVEMLDRLAKAHIAYLSQTSE